MAKKWIDVPERDHSVPVMIEVGGNSARFPLTVRIPGYQAEIEVGNGGVDPPPPPPPTGGDLPIGTYRSNGNPGDAQTFLDWLGSGKGSGVPIMLQDVIVRDTFGQMNFSDGWSRTTVQRAVAWRRVEPALRTINLSYPPVPGQARFQLHRSASGEFDPHYRAAAGRMIDDGFTHGVIRVGHEPDGDWFPYGDRGDINAAKQFAATFRRVVDCFRAVARERGVNVGWRYVYNPTHNRFLRKDLLEAQYPGDEHCDIISTDTYDQFKELPYHDFDGRWGLTLRRWDALMEFADRRGKPAAIDEWGVWNANETWNGGIDNPTFVERLSQVIKRDRARLAYHCPFDCLQKHRLQPATISPKASAVFFKHWHASAGAMTRAVLDGANIHPREPVAMARLDPAFKYVINDAGEEELVEPRDLTAVA